MKARSSLWRSAISAAGAALSRRAPGQGGPKQDPEDRVTSLQPIGHKLARAIEAAAERKDPSEALAILDAVPGGWRAWAIAPDIPFSYAVKLAGTCLQAGLVDDAIELILSQIRGTAVPPSEALLLDPFYFGPGGHRHQYNRFYLEQMRQVGFAGGFVHLPPDERTRSGALSGYPILPRLQAHRALRAPRENELPGLNALYFGVFQHILPKRRPQLLVVSTANHSFIDGFAHYVAETERSGRASLVLGVNQAYWSDSEPIAKLRGPFNSALNVLAAIPDLRVLVVAESRPIAEGFAKATGNRWETVVGSFVSGQWEDTGLAVRRADGRATVGYAGRNMPERGGDLVPPLVVRSLAARADVAWRARIEDWAMEAHASSPVSNALRQAVEDGLLEIMPANLPIGDYYAALRSMDIMVMPYRESYDIRGSGLVAECLRFGIVIVAPETSTAAQFSREAGGGLVTFRDRSVEAIGAAIDEALDRLPELKERSAKAIQAFEDREDLRRVKQFIAEARE